MSLVSIAEQMKLKAHNEGTAYRGLHNGLCLLLSRHDDEYALALWRADVPPSPTEIAVIRRDFGIPAHALESEPSAIAWLDDRRIRAATAIVLVWSARPSRSPSPTPHQRGQLGSIIAGGDLEAARIYAENQTAQGRTDWTLCPEWPRWSAILSGERQLQEAA